MRPTKYPLEPLVEVREGKVDEATEDLAKAARDRQAADQRRRDSERRHEAHVGETARVRRAEDEALARGELAVADRVREDAWRVRTTEQEKALLAEVDRANAEASRAHEREEQARGALASRKAEAKVVAEDRARWREAQRKRQEATEEEASSDAWRSRKA